MKFKVGLTVEDRLRLLENVADTARGLGYEDMEVAVWQLAQKVPLIASQPIEMDADDWSLLLSAVQQPTFDLLLRRQITRQLERQQCPLHDIDIDAMLFSRQASGLKVTTGRNDGPER